MPRRNPSRNDYESAELERDRREAERDDDRRYASYDAATGVYTQQTQLEFHASLTADIQRALDAGCLDERPPAKSLRDIQAEEAAAKVAKREAEQKVLAAAKAELERQERIATEKAAAEAAWNADRAARDAAGHKPCWVCWQYAGETQYHAPKRDICALATQLFYVFDRHGYPHTAYVRRDEMEALRARKAMDAAAEQRKRHEAPQHGLAEFLDVSGGLVAPPAPAGKKKGKKPTVEKFSLDEI
jgi:hypothetical protein